MMRLSIFPQKKKRKCGYVDKAKEPDFFVLIFFAKHVDLQEIEQLCNSS